MKAVKTTLMLTLVTITLFACNAQSSREHEDASVGDGDLQVYYFHFTKRCATCNAVENETKVALEMFYADQMKEGTIIFTSLNLEEEDGKEIANQLSVSGQSLLLVRGAEMVNLTNEGFMNARTKPDRFHEILRTQIDKLL
jgi:hypothetical protein